MLCISFFFFFWGGGGGGVGLIWSGIFGVRVVPCFPLLGLMPSGLIMGFYGGRI